MANDNLALLIDGDNVSNTKMARLLVEIAKYGTASVRRIYGDWTNPNMQGWKTTLQNHSLTPVQQFAYKFGTKTNDGAMIIDAMDLLYTGRFSTFCLVSSDSDFTRLASRIREQGLRVYGFGEPKTSKAFVAACDKFIYFDILNEASEELDVPQPAAKTSKPAPKPIVVRDEPREQVAVMLRSRSVSPSASPSQISTPSTGPMSERDQQIEQVAIMLRSQSVSAAQITRPGTGPMSERDQPRSQSVPTAPKIPKPGVGTAIVRNDHVAVMRRSRAVSGAQITRPGVGTMAVRDPTIEQRPIEQRPIDFAARDGIKRAIKCTKEHSDGWVSLVDVEALLRQLAPDLVARNYGYARLHELLEATGLVDVKFKAMSNKPSIALVRLKNVTTDRWSRY
ncbi:hypothetical protein VTL71DRAFT_6312 [Oculimacula yallundae]|uniref:HTH OST-type domain-containing protein n=1 Tax=Oculimacula yallundae TaxID=86028 RepID=A0ABR4BXR5_9HELO